MMFRKRVANEKRHFGKALLKSSIPKLIDIKVLQVSFLREQTYFYNDFDCIIFNFESVVFTIFFFFANNFLQLFSIYKNIFIIYFLGIPNSHPAIHRSIFTSLNEPELSLQHNY